MALVRFPAGQGPFLWAVSASRRRSRRSPRDPAAVRGRWQDDEHRSRRDAGRIHDKVPAGWMEPRKTLGRPVVGVLMKMCSKVRRGYLRRSPADQAPRVNKNPRMFLRVLFPAVVLIVYSSCATLDRKGFQQGIGLPHHEGGGLRSLLFLSGRPSKGESLFSAFAEPEEARKILLEDLDTISQSGTLKFRAVGWTDDLECSAKYCAELSMRRASLVTDWLIKNGAPRERISSPVAGGKYLGEVYRPSEAERTVSRRVDVELVM